MQHVLQSYPSHLVPILETVLFLVGLLVLFLWPDASRRLADKLLAGLAVKAESTWRVILVVALLAGLGNAATTPDPGPPDSRRQRRVELPAGDRHLLLRVGSPIHRARTGRW